MGVANVEQIAAAGVSDAASSQPGMGARGYLRAINRVWFMAFILH